jgi:RNA polymerase sigma-70 factor (ECF subfamily)
MSDEGDTWSVLMRQAQDGDRDAYRRLLVAVTPYVRAVAARVLRDPQEAEDAVQDVLLTLHAVRQTYDPARPFRPWLGGLMRHRLVDRQRGRQRRAAREVALTEAHETFADAGSNSEPAGLDSRALHAALQGLPVGQRQAIELMKLREMSLQEAAAVSGMSVAALKVATHRGLKALRQLLGGRTV